MRNIKHPLLLIVMPYNIIKENYSRPVIVLFEVCERSHQNHLARWAGGLLGCHINTLTTSGSIISRAISPARPLPLILPASVISVSGYRAFGEQKWFPSSHTAYYRRSFSPLLQIEKEM